MTVGAALLLIAAGAVLRFAISAVSVYGINLPIVGDILMGVGLLGLVLWLVVWAPWARSRHLASGRYRHDRRYEPTLEYPARRAVPPTDARTRDLYRDPYYQDQYPS